MTTRESVPPPRAENTKTDDSPNTAAVQGYIRDNPEIAVEYLAALFKANIDRLAPPTFRSRLTGLFRHAADMLTGRDQRAGSLYRANLEQGRKPDIAHIVTCSDPILDELVAGSAGRLLLSRRVGAWPGADRESQSPLAAELSLSSALGAPIVFSLKHADLALSGRPVRHISQCDCGCAAVSLATTMICEEAAGETTRRDERSAKVRWIAQMAKAAGPAALREAQAHGTGPDDWSAFSRHMRRGFVDDSLAKIEEMIAADPGEAAAPRRIIGAIVDQRTGDLWVRGPDNIYGIYNPQRSLRQIEDDLYRVATGQPPRKPQAKAPGAPFLATPART